MTHDAILAEIGEILATGIQRVVANNFKSPATLKNCADPLDVLGEVEAPCRATTEFPE